MSMGMPDGGVSWTYTGTGSAINKELGFKPVVLIIANETDGGVFMWSASMTDAHVSDVGASSHSNSNGVTPYDGTSACDAAGVTLGTGLSTSGKVYHAVAWRGESID